MYYKKENKKIFKIKELATMEKYTTLLFGNQIQTNLYV